MSIILLLYLIDFVKNVSTSANLIFGIFILISIILSFFYFGAFLSEDDDGIEKVGNLFKILFSKIWIALIALIICILIPDKQTMYLMLGANYLQQSDLPAKVSEVLNLKLDDVLKDLKDKK